MITQRFRISVFTLILESLLIVGCASDSDLIIQIETEESIPTEVHSQVTTEPFGSQTPEVESTPEITFQLTFSMVSRTGYFIRLLSMDVSCLDEEQLCFGPPEILFERQWDRNGIPPITSFDWHPGGKLIAMEDTRITERGDIVVADWDGQNEMNISKSSGPDRSPIWNPDGTKVYFITRDENYYMRVAAYTLEVDLGVELLPFALDFSPLDLEFFPDGSSFIITGSETSGSFQGMDQIFLAELNGDLLRLSQDATDYTSATISPDGQFIALVKEIDLDVPKTNFRIYLMDLSTGVEEPLAVEFSEALYLHQPAWAPFGDWIAFTVRKQDGSESIYISRSDGSNLTLLYENSSFIGHLDWRSFMIP